MLHIFTVALASAASHGTYTSMPGITRINAISSIAWMGYTVFTYGNTA